MTNTNNPIYRRDIEEGYEEYLTPHGDYVYCSCVVAQVKFLQEQGLSSEEILNKIVEELS